MYPEDPDSDPDHSQNLIISSLYLFRHILKISSKFVHKFLSSLGHKRTNVQTHKQTHKHTNSQTHKQNPGKNITSLAEVMKRYYNTCKWYCIQDFYVGDFLWVCKYLGIFIYNPYTPYHHLNLNLTCVL